MLGNTGFWELIDHAGEVLWGKALYTPTLDHLSGANKGNVNDELKKAIVLFVLNDLIGSAFDAIGLGEDAGVFDSDQSNDFRRRIAAIYEMTASQKLQHLIYQAIRRILGR